MPERLESFRRDEETPDYSIVMSPSRAVLDREPSTSTDQAQHANKGHQRNSRTPSTQKGGFEVCTDGKS